jgi:hypothetical protein
MTKNKTLAAWLSFLGGPLGLHRFYLFGLGDLLGWLLPIPTALGFYGLQRVQAFGLDDQWSWVLIPLLGFTVAGCALSAIVTGLTAEDVWNEKFNPKQKQANSSGKTQWLTIAAIVCSLLIGTSVLLASIAFSFQRYFEYQVEESRKISQ